MLKTGKFGQIKVGKIDEAILNEGLTASRVGLTNKFIVNIDEDEMIGINNNNKIFLNDIEVSISSYNINYLKSEITIESNITIEETDVITCDLYIYDLETVGGFFQWTLNSVLDTQETVSFESEGYKEYTPINKGASITANSYFEIENLDKISDYGVMLLKLFKDKNTKTGRICFAVITNKDTSTPVDGIIEESISFESTGKVERF